MIIQCEQCHTKFKLDDSKVTDKGVKVRCAKCKHVFTVCKEQAPEEPVIAFGDVLDNTTGSGAVPEPQVTQEMPDFPANEAATTSLPESSLDEQSFSFETDASVDTPSFEVTAGNDFAISSVEEQKGSSAGAVGEVDFDSFDFGDASGIADEVGGGSVKSDFGDVAVVQQPISRDADEFAGLDFSGDSMFGEVVPQAPEEPAADISFDLQMDDFAASMGVEGRADKHSETLSASEPAEAPFSLGEIDFGEELTSVAVQQINPEELKPGQDLLFAPLVENQNPLSSDTAKETISFDDALPPVMPATEPEEDLPPLSISSRRKQGPMPALLAVLGVVLAIVVAYFGYSSLTGDKAAVPQEAGRISLRSVEASFVKNKALGDLLVIKGEAVNEFSMPRASIQVKGMVYGAKGEVLVSKNAFCGNPMNPEQLSTISLDALESAMANQFGDSLTNMEVLPGKSVPFVVVLVKPATDAKDYGVEPAGSTVAAAKQ